MSTARPSSGENAVSREGWDHLTPNLLDDNDEALGATKSPVRHGGKQSQAQPIHPPSLQQNNSSSPEGADSDSINLQKASLPPSKAGDTSPRPKRNPPAYGQRELLPGSGIGYAITAEDSRMVVAIDYGTTFTGLAVAKTQSDHADLNEIEVLQNWGGSSGVENNQKVRTMISYVKDANGETQWGPYVSNHVTAMVNTKLELDPQPKRFEELELTLYLLRGTGNLAFEHLKKIGRDPAYSSAAPEQIVRDYLKHICKCARSIDNLLRNDITQLGETNTALDVVVTVPANWSFEANDKTFKAIQGGGFNRATFPTLQDMILVSEAEAAAFFAIRDHQKTQNVDLRVNDCFILCDAGGGTVDVVSYQVKNITPQLELERATEPKSDKCGSVYIDTAFKNWLRDVIGVANYGKLDRHNARNRITAHTLEDGPIRELVGKFIAQKHLFSSSSQDVCLDLPAPLEGLDLKDRVQQGELTIHREEMEALFSPCVNGVIELLDDQIEKVKKAKHRRVRNVFLVGGFGASPYLQEQLVKALHLGDSTLRRPNSDKSLTAVVQGAVIYGIEKSHHSGVRYMSAITQSYGIVIDGRFEWLIRKGDLVLSTEKRIVRTRYFCIPLKRCPSRKYDLIVYTYIKRDEDDDGVPALWEDGQHEVERAGVVKCDFSTMTDGDLRLPLSHQRPGNIELGPFRCHLQLSSTSLEVDVLHQKTTVGHCAIGVKTDSRSTVPEHDWN